MKNVTIGQLGSTDLGKIASFEGSNGEAALGWLESISLKRDGSTVLEINHLFGLGSSKHKLHPDFGVMVLEDEDRATVTLAQLLGE